MPSDKKRGRPTDSDMSETSTEASGVLRRSHFFTELPSQPNLVCFKDMASFMPNKLREMKKQIPIGIVTTAAKIIKVI